MNLKFEDLSIEQKLGMVLCARPMTDDDVDFVVELIKNHSLGCVQVSPKKSEHMRRIREAADYPVLIICDTETGFPASNLPKIPLVALSACNNPAYCESFAKGVVVEAMKAGFNGTWGPVIDILTCDGPCSVHRKFSDDPMRVAKTAEVIAKVYADNSYLSCGKHYPGGKTTPYDSHMTTKVSESTEEELLESHLVPYKYLMEKGLLPSIMTSHCTFTNIDPEHPGTLSPKVQSILRRQGFDGVSFTDSLAMMAILQKYGEEKSMGIAIAAGNDIVLPDYHTSDRICYEYLKNNYRNGVFTEERLNEAVRRVLKAQELVGRKPANPSTLTDEDLQNFENIAKDCITAVTDEGLDAALPRDNKRRLFVIVTENSFNAEEDFMETTTTQWYYPKRIAERIRQNFPDASIEYIPEFSGKKDHHRILREASTHDEVVFITFCVTMAYMGTDGLTRRTESVINALALSDKLAAVVHFGNPFALKHLVHVRRKIFGYQIPDSQLYAMDVLAGKLPAKGILPFHIDFQ